MIEKTPIAKMPSPEYKILKYGNPILKEKSIKIVKIDREIKECAQEMLAWVKSTKIGYGLAAIQIGNPIQLFVLHIEDEDIVFINPTITEIEGTDVMEEGCLSIPYAYIGIKRAYKIKMKFQDLDGKEIEREFSGLPAKAIQHEIDHLNGILMIDIVSPLKRKILLNRIKTIKKRNQWDNW